MVWPRAKPSFAPTLIRHLKILQAKCMVTLKGQFVFGYQKTVTIGIYSVIGRSTCTYGGLSNHDF